MNYLKCSIVLKEALSMYNMRAALIYIGKEDPMNVRRYYLLKKFHRFHMLKCHGTINEKDYLRRGILNVRKKINCKLGKDGKLSNRMIYCMLFPAQEHNRHFHEIHTYHIKVNYKNYIKIVSAIYSLLLQCDKKKAKKLFKIALKDIEVKVLLDKPLQDKYKTVAPAQTHTVLDCRGDEYCEHLFSELHKSIEEDKDDAKPSK